MEPEDGPGDARPLSAREAEVLRLVADGLSDGEIADRLIVSPRTVHRHVTNIRTSSTSRRAPLPPCTPPGSA